MSGPRKRFVWRWGDVATAALTIALTIALIGRVLG